MAGMRYGLFALAAVILSGWPDASAQPTAPAPTATSWVLERGRGIPSRLKRTPQLRMEGQKLSGSTGCNAFTAALVDKGEKRVAIEQVALTRKLCAPRLDKVETLFVRALEETQYLEQKGRRLMFLSAKRQPLLVWTRSKSAAQRSAPARRYARVRRHRRHARVRHHRRSAEFVYRGCRGWLAGAPVSRARVF
jgi:heat shock protein HslJ